MGNVFDFNQKENFKKISDAVHEAYSPIREGELQLAQIKAYLNMRKKVLEHIASKNGSMQLEYELRKVKNLLDPVNCSAPSVSDFYLREEKRWLTREEFDVNEREGGWYGSGIYFD